MSEAKVRVILNWVMKTFILWTGEFLNNVGSAQHSFLSGKVVLHDKIFSFHVGVINDKLHLTIFAFALNVVPDNFLNNLFVNFVRTVHLVFVK